MIDAEQFLQDGAISLPDNGICCFPGKMLRLDTEQIRRNGKLQEIELFAWYDKGATKANCFIIELGGSNYYITDYFFKVNLVWNYLMDKFKAE
jgi:hypothetical protein